MRHFCTHRDLALLNYSVPSTDYFELNMCHEIARAATPGPQPISRTRRPGRNGSAFTKLAILGKIFPDMEAQCRNRR